MTLALLVVGSPAVITDSNHGPRRVTIERVGRKFVYVEGDRAGFDRETGRRNDARGNTHLRTLDEHEASCAAERARRQLRDFGIDVSRRITDVVVIEIREALVSVIGPSVPVRPNTNAQGGSDG